MHLVLRQREMEERWRQLCDRYLPLASEDSVWRFNRRRRAAEPVQGWKLHVSSTLLDASRVLGAIAPLLVRRRVQFKAPSSLRELSRINSGLYYGYSQVGKIITVYPRTNKETVLLAQDLHKLTRRRRGPLVPFDRRYRPFSNVYLRYGAFTRLEIQHNNGHSIPAVRDPAGKLIPDNRECPSAKPEWAADLLPHGRRPRGIAPSPLATRFRIFRALIQRGKGGVYQAIDLSTNPPRLCLVKEGRKHGEMRWDGHDGAWMVKNEERVLSRLHASGVEVPRIYAAFEADGNYYLVTEFIDGENLQIELSRRQKRISLNRILQYGIQLSSFMAELHAAGWIWRDCKPTNIILTREQILRPLDFEGACPSDDVDPLPWGTPGFSPPEWRDDRAQSGMAGDCFALGAILYLLLTGRVPSAPAVPMEKFRRGLPHTLRELVAALLSSIPPQRPSAELVRRALSRIQVLLVTNGAPEAG
jgi:serine/threonine protein kinase